MRRRIRVVRRVIHSTSALTVFALNPEMDFWDKPIDKFLIKIESSFISSRRRGCVSHAPHPHKVEWERNSMVPFPMTRRVRFAFKRIFFLHVNQFEELPQSFRQDGGSPRGVVHNYGVAQELRHEFKWDGSRDVGWRLSIKGSLGVGSSN